LYTPWDQVIAAITPAYVLIVLAVVLSMVLSGFFVGRLMNMYPIESACVTACHSGLGGTGDVAILSSCNRMELMPFSQISTRIGGVGTVVAAAILMRIFL
jgi:malate:Na+ symporter